MKRTTWLTERYIQHNPAFSSGRQIVMTGVQQSRPASGPKLEHQDRRRNHSGQGHCLRGLRQYPARPAQSGQTYTTTHFDRWRSVDGKADEHWDEGAINAGGGQGKGKQ